MLSTKASGQTWQRSPTCSRISLCVLLGRRGGWGPSDDALIVHPTSSVCTSFSITARNFLPKNITWCAQMRSSRPYHWLINVAPVINDTPVAAHMAWPSRNDFWVTSLRSSDWVTQNGQCSPSLCNSRDICLIAFVFHLERVSPWIVTSRFDTNVVDDMPKS